MAENNPHVVVLRDQATIKALAERLPGMRRVVIVGNGGIALEVAHALSGVEVSQWIWLGCLAVILCSATSSIASCF